MGVWEHAKASFVFSRKHQTVLDGLDGSVGESSLCRSCEVDQDCAWVFAVLNDLVENVFCGSGAHEECLWVVVKEVSTELRLPGAAVRVEVPDDSAFVWLFVKLGDEFSLPVEELVLGKEPEVLWASRSKSSYVNRPAAALRLRTILYGLCDIACRLQVQSCIPSLDC